MQEYPIKRTHVKAFPENLAGKIREIFEVDPTENDGRYRISFGALEYMDVGMGKTGKTLLIETKSKTGIEDENVILDTNRRFRKYLDEVTGYSTKERVKKAKSVE